ncbi:MAG: hypothetical protein H0U60_02490 [Blastocatellia bacterium]|nr:hypothetical protein [Blastocatellia bacterium]
MAALTITTIRLVRGDDEHQETLAANVAVPITTPMVTQDPTTGNWVLALATTTGNLGTPAIALHVAVAKQALTAVRAPCILDLGEALAGLAIGAKVYASDTAGTLADAAGTVSRVMGTVIGAFASTTADKLLRLE